MSSRELFERHARNPILTSADWPYPANAVFNPAAALVDGETILLARVEDLRGISHLTMVRSANGLDGWSVDAQPLLAPDEAIESEQWGFEDPRTVWLPELERWAITCTAYGPPGPAVYLATTADFRTVERHGVIKRAEDKNAALLPDRIDGKWILFHRPSVGAVAGAGGEIVLSRSPDLVSWSMPEPVLAPREGAWWDSRRIGIGPPPMRTEHGWLILYHGVKDTVAGGLYRIGLALTALAEPERVTHRLPEWILGPHAPYERVGDVANAVFPCGAVHDTASGELRLYYGAADTSIAVATAKLDDLLDAVLAAPL
ncbi:MAG: glycosidase [Gaiellaceae bacterium]